MARPTIPPALTRGPFTVEDARRSGLTERQLQGSAWQRIGHGLYLWSGLEVDPGFKLEAAWRRLPSGSGFSGWTAAWCEGLEGRFVEPIHVTVPVGSKVAQRAGLTVHREQLHSGDLVKRGGWWITAPIRTLTDLAAWAPLEEVVPVVDAALHRKLVRPADLTRRLASMEGRKGSRRLRLAIEHADGRAESPMESRLRLLLVLAGLGRPELQANLRDRWGRVIARVDLYYPQRRLAIEFDGGVHRDSLVDDNRRQNRLLAAGYALLRFTGPDVLGRPDQVVASVEAALSGRAFPGKSTLPLRLIG